MKEKKEQIIQDAIKKNPMIADYTEQIEEIVKFAKKTNYNMETGSIEELSRLWLHSQQAMWKSIEENKDEAKRIIKSLL